MMCIENRPSGCRLRDNANNGYQSGDNVVDDAAINVRQPKIPTAESIRQPLVIESKEVQDRGMQIVHVHLVLNCEVTEVIGGAVAVARLHPAARQPDRVSMRVVIPARGSAVNLRDGRASE